MKKIIHRRAGGRSTPKKRRITLSLSSRSVAFLDNLRSETRAPSTSALVERIIHDLEGRAELDDLNARMKAYYDSRPESENREEREWGITGESGLDAALKGRRRGVAAHE